MALDKHRTQVLDSPTVPVFTDRSIVGQQLSVANAAGAAAAAVSTVVTFPEPLPPAYQVIVSPTQDATWYVTTRTLYGFTVVLTPRLAANALAAGTFDVLVVSV
jgi:hypothetical protein